MLATVVNWLLEQIFESFGLHNVRPPNVVNWLLEQIFESGYILFHHVDWL